jgi:hypothetical protein
MTIARKSTKNGRHQTKTERRNPRKRRRRKKKSQQTKEEEGKKKEAQVRCKETTLKVLVFLQFR